MPNWTFCKLKAPSSVLEQYVNDNNEFDFNLVIPRPKEYDDPDLIVGGNEDFAIYWYLSNKGKYKYDEIPVPRSVRERYFTYFSLSYVSHTQLPQTEEESEKLYVRGSKYVYLADTYGSRDWYSWCNKNWGTKWNACDCDISRINKGCIEFNTAWCPPIPVIKKIFEDNPGCRIGFYWSNEDWDGYHHIVRYKNGRIDLLNCHEGMFF